MEKSCRKQSLLLSYIHLLLMQVHMHTASLCIYSPLPSLHRELRRTEARKPHDQSRFPTLHPSRFSEGVKVQNKEAGRWCMLKSGGGSAMAPRFLCFSLSLPVVATLVRSARSLRSFALVRYALLRPLDPSNRPCVCRAARVRTTKSRALPLRIAF